MLLNNFANYTPMINKNEENNNTESNRESTNNNMNKRGRNGLLRALCCNNNDDSCSGRGLNLSTILFFVLIFLILFYND